MQKPNPNRDNDERTEHQGLRPKTNHPGSAGGQRQSHNSKTDPPHIPKTLVRWTTNDRLSQFN
jgi:hypothetical protein